MKHQNEAQLQFSCPYISHSVITIILLINIYFYPNITEELKRQQDLFSESQ